MNPDLWFNDLPVLGKLPPAEAVAKLREIGEIDTAEVLKSAGEDLPQTCGA